PLLLLFWSPTAHTFVLERAETPKRPDSRGAGPFTMRQRVPFQCSMRGCVFLPPLVSEMPTAQVSLAEMAVMPKRLAEAMAGVETMLQVRRFQCSTRGWLTLVLLLTTLPTAQTLLAAMALTPMSVLKFVPVVGLATIRQAEPFQCSMSDLRMLL